MGPILGEKLASWAKDLAAAVPIAKQRTARVILIVMVSMPIFDAVI
jgi:hypothetical protein